MDTTVVISGEMEPHLKQGIIKRIAGRSEKLGYWCMNSSISFTER